jgi:hypothetical protein
MSLRLLLARLAVYLRVEIYRRKMDADKAQQLAIHSVVAGSLSEKSKSCQSRESISGASSRRHEPQSRGTSFLPIIVWKFVSRVLIICMAECAGCIRLQGEVNDLKTKYSNLETKYSNLETKYSNVETELNVLQEKDEKLTVREICLTLEQHICVEAIGEKRARSEDMHCIATTWSTTRNKFRLFSTRKMPSPLGRASELHYHFARKAREGRAVLVETVKCLSREFAAKHKKDPHASYVLSHNGEHFPGAEYIS